jgi:hypothetical protein
MLYQFLATYSANNCNHMPDAPPTVWWWCRKVLSSGTGLLRAAFRQPVAARFEYRAFDVTDPK